MNFSLTHLSRLAWQLPAVLFITSVFLLFVNEYAIACNSRRIKNIAYVSPNASDFDTEHHRLDMYQPRKTQTKLRPVVIFIHGGSWNSGSKNLYFFIGRRLAKQGIVAVVINYRLAPTVQVPAMANDCARAVEWTQQHIAEYGGDPNRIFVMGHSAGGGFAALLTNDNQLFTALGMAKNPVKGVILDDPAGLDMYDYLTKMEYPGDEKYLIPYGKDPAVWRAVSPMYYVDADTPPMLLYVGERTYPSIQNSSRRFDERLTKAGIRHQYQILPRKKHVGMVTQLFWKNNIIYRDLLKFVGAKTD